MSTFKSWSKLFVLALMVSFAFGCGGGGGGYSVSNNSVPTLAPYTEPDTQHVSEYEISGVLEDGTWHAISGSGTATGSDGTFTLNMVELQGVFSVTRAANGVGTTYVTGIQRWTLLTQRGGYKDTIELSSSKDKLDITHIDTNTWRCVYPNGTILTIKPTSYSTAEATQEGTFRIGTRSYQYTMHSTLQKQSNSNSVPEPEPAPEATPVSNDPVPTPEPIPENGNDAYTDTYDIASVMNGNWYGVSGNGIAIGVEGTFNLNLLNITFSASDTQISGNIGSTYVTSTQYWNYVYINGYTYITPLYTNNALIDMVHVGNNTWLLKASDNVVNDTTMTIVFTSSTTAIVTQDTIATVYNNPYRCSLRYTIRKSY